MRTLRSLALGHLLGHALLEEGDRRVSLLERLLAHARTTAAHAVYYGEGRDVYDVRGRVAHESLFNVADGQFRCPGTQQGYSPFTTWTRGLAWVLLGFAEELEFLETLERRSARVPSAAATEVVAWMLRAAQASADFYIEATPPDGIPYWDTGAPGLVHLDLDRPADPFNDHEPVDASAAAIAAQGLLRLGRFLAGRGRRGRGATLRPGRADRRPGPCWPRRICPRLPTHQGLLLHSVYHRPNGWDYVPPGRKVPCGESSQWGDYHLRELGPLRAASGRGRSATTGSSDRERAA